MHSLKKNFIVYFLACLSVILLSSPQTFADTYVGGIINTDITWTLANSPYTLTNRVQIAYGATLSIEPGVIVNGNNNAIQVWGVLDAVGTKTLKIIFNDVEIKPGTNNDNEPFLIEMQFSGYNGGSIYYPTGDAIYGSLNLRDSKITNIPYMHLWYPTSDCFIERNIFINSGGISVGTTAGVNVYISNNVFYMQQKKFEEGDYAVEAWANCGSQIIVDYNSFLSTDRIALNIPPGFTFASMTAVNNYWNTSNTSIIESMIFDKNDDLGCSSYINYTPFLTSPHPDTPVLQFNLIVNKSGEGNGIVTTSTLDINCGSDCSENYNPDTLVTLEASSDTGSMFIGWSDCDSISNNTCTVTMDDDKSITANFIQNCAYSLTINIIPPGSGTVTKNPDKVSYCNNEQVTLTANPSVGYDFNSWDGVDSSNGTAASITMNGSRTVTANFSQQTSTGPELTGYWISLIQQCQGTKCKIKGILDIQNVGNDNAVSSFIRFYLSDDTVYDAGDMFLKQVSTGTLKAGGSKNRTLSYSFPAGISANDKYIIAVIDADNTVVESNESVIFQEH